MAKVPTPDGRQFLWLHHNHPWKPLPPKRYKYQGFPLFPLLFPKTCFPRETALGFPPHRYSAPVFLTLTQPFSYGAEYRSHMDTDNSNGSKEFFGIGFPLLQRVLSSSAVLWSADLSPDESSPPLPHPPKESLPAEYGFFHLRDS